MKDWRILGLNKEGRPVNFIVEAEDRREALKAGKARIQKDYGFEAKALRAVLVL